MKCSINKKKNQKLLGSACSLITEWKSKKSKRRYPKTWQANKITPRVSLHGEIRRASCIYQSPFSSTTSLSRTLVPPTPKLWTFQRDEAFESLWNFSLLFDSSLPGILLHPLFSDFCKRIRKEKKLLFSISWE